MDLSNMNYCRCVITMPDLHSWWIVLQRIRELQRITNIVMVRQGLKAHVQHNKESTLTETLSTFPFQQISFRDGWWINSLWAMLSLSQCLSHWVMALKKYICCLDVVMMFKSNLSKRWIAHDTNNSTEKSLYGCHFWRKDVNMLILLQSFLYVSLGF